MSKVGVVSLSTSDNYGAVLQSYALIKYLEEIGCDPFLLNYKQEKVSLRSYASHPIASAQKIVGLRPGLKSIFNRFNRRRGEGPTERELLRRKVFASFRDQFSRMTSEVFTHERLSSACPEADAYITGSDAVWAADVFFRPPVFLLDFVPPAMKRVAYAPSFAKGSIEPYQRRVFKEQLSKFHAISVREQSGVDLVRELCEAKVQRVLDPTFLLTSYSELSDPSVVPDYPFMFVYRLSEEDQLASHTDRIISSLARDMGLAIVHVAPESAVKSKNYENDIIPTPGQFLSLIENADFVVTNSFHGVVFSILNRKRFICTRRDLLHGKKNLRMIELLDLLGLGELFVDSESRASNIVKAMNKSKVHEASRDVLDCHIEASRRFLLDALS